MIVTSFYKTFEHIYIKINHLMLSLMNVLLSQDPLNSDLSKELIYKGQNYSVTLNTVPTTAEKLEDRVGLLTVRHPSNRKW